MHIQVVVEEVVILILQLDQEVQVVVAVQAQLVVLLVQVLQIEAVVAEVVFRLMLVHLQLMLVGLVDQIEVVEEALVDLEKTNLPLPHTQLVH